MTPEEFNDLDRNNRMMRVVAQGVFLADDPQANSLFYQVDHCYVVVLLDADASRIHGVHGFTSGPPYERLVELRMVN